MIVFMGLKFEEFCKYARFCLRKALPERSPVANVRNKRAQFRSFYSENLHINAFLEFVVFSLCCLVLNCYLISTKVDILRNCLIMNQLVTNNLIIARILHDCQTSDLLRSNEIISSLSLKCSSNCAMRARSSSFSFAMSVEPERAMLLPLNEETALLPIDR